MRANPSVNSTLNSSSAPSAISGQTSGRRRASTSVDGLPLIGNHSGGREIRMTNDESRMNVETRKGPPLRSGQDEFRFSSFGFLSAFGFRASDFIRPSEFVIRHSSLAALRRDGLHNRRQLNLVARQLTNFLPITQHHHAMAVANHLLQLRGA